MADEIRKASDAFFRLQAVQTQLEEANLGQLELAGAGKLVTIAGIVRSAEERDAAIAIVRAAGFLPHDSITVDDPSVTDELAVMAREARSSQDGIAILERAITLADARDATDWRIRLRLQLEAAFRGPLRYAEATKVCREALAIAETAETLYALGWCLHESAAITRDADLTEIDGLYQRVLAVTEAGTKLHDSATRMLGGLHRMRDLRAKKSS